MKKMLAGALFGLVVLGADRAEANMKLSLTVRSCDSTGQPWKTTDQDGRLGRLTIKDQAGQVVQTEASIHFSASRCQATFTSTFTAGTLARFTDPDDPLFLTLEACTNSATSCPLNGATLDSKPVVFQNAALDSVVPDVFKVLSDDIDAAAAAAAAAVAAEAQARAAADQAEAQARAAADQAEALRALAAEQSLQDGLAAEVTRAMAAELAEESARQGAIAAEAQARADAIAAEAQARADAIAAEAQARADAIAAEAAARTSADQDEALARAAAVSDEATTRAAGDQEVKDYADGRFLPLAGGTIDGELVVNGTLRLNGGVSWDSCPAGLDSLEHVFGAAGGGSNRLCASEMKTTGPSVEITEVVGSYIAPICPMVTQVVQNYVEIGGPAALDGINLLLQQVSGLLNDQITPFANGLLGATTGVTNQLIDAINGKITDVNALIAAHTAGINGVIDAYNDLVTKVNAALSSSTNGLNGSIGAINTYLAGVRADINGVVGGINTSLASASSTFNTLNSNPSGINNALATLTGSLNTQIGTINGLLDSISAAQSSIVGGINTGFGAANTFFANARSATNSLINSVNATITSYDQMGYWIDENARAVNAALNSSFGAVNSGIVTATNWATNTNNWMVERLFNPIANWCVSDLFCVSDVIGGATSLWVSPVVGQGATDFSLGQRIEIFTGSRPTVSTLAPGSMAGLSAPSALGHVGTVGAPSISSLGLPNVNLGSVSSALAAPSIGTVTGPQIAGANLSSVAAPALPPIPHVQLPSIPAWSGFQLEDAVDFQAVSDVIGSTMDPICADIEGTTQSYIDAFLGDVDPLVPDFADAEDVCGELGAHVCGPTEIALLAGEDGTPAEIGYGFGDWTGPGRVMFNQSATSGLMLDVDWPFLHPDASKLMTFPPGFPFTFTPPVLPTGNFRCCASSSAVE